MLRIKEHLDLARKHWAKEHPIKYDKGVNTLPRNNNNTSHHREID